MEVGNVDRHFPWLNLFLGYFAVYLEKQFFLPLSTMIKGVNHSILSLPLLITEDALSSIYNASE